MPGVSLYAKNRYLPEEERKGVALCLSGGGYRATLFHLGALGRLNELGILGAVDTVSSVSGGSITAACMAVNIPWPLRRPLGTEEWERFAEGVRALTRRNIRTPAALKRWIPTHWFDTSAGVRALMKKYEEHLTDKLLFDLPDSPNFVFCSTDLSFGANWVFEKSRTGSYQAGYKVSPPADWSIARAVAASSCFPPVFNPLPAGLGPGDLKGGTYPEGRERDRILSDLRLSDGGVYDNLGMEPVWKDHQVMMVSDGGATFDYEAHKNLVWCLKRYVAIAGKQALSLRKRWFISNCIKGILEGAYWGIGGARTSYPESDELGYTKDLASRVISEIRTDMDAFSDAEACVLQNHGYLLADIAVRSHLSKLLPAAPPEPRIPFPDWMDEDRVRRALAGSNKRRILGR